MTFIAPTVDRPSGSLAAPEAELLAGLLDYHRATLLYKCAGLTADQLATAPYPDSNLTLHGLVRHLAKVERIWFRERFAGEDVPRLYSTPERRDADFEDVGAATVEADYAALLAEQAAARAIAAAASVDDVLVDATAARAVAVAASLDKTVVDADGDEISLRFIHVHMIGEYARHNGHADFVRQAIDGATGA